MNAESKVKIFFLIDVSTENEARGLLDEVTPHVQVIKIGYKLICNVGIAKAVALVKEYDKEIMLDIQIIDILSIMTNYVSGIFSNNINYFSLEASNQYCAPAFIAREIDNLVSNMLKFGLLFPKIVAIPYLHNWTFKNFVKNEIAPDNRLKWPKIDKKEQEFITSIVLGWDTTIVIAGINYFLISSRDIKIFNKTWPNMEFICQDIHIPWLNSDNQKQNKTISSYEAVKTGCRNLIIDWKIEDYSKKIIPEAIKKVWDDIDRAMEKS
ncbi:orotidine 5'-phosphate decarboxylase [Candidatus Parcubacteria bacterium]|nr:orotidine 5'-phosphate decarboxylase [Candidatus Parcubacteria bacterium]